MTDPTQPPPSLANLPLFAARPQAHRLAGPLSAAPTTAGDLTRPAPAAVPTVASTAVASGHAGGSSAFAQALASAPTGQGRILPAGPPATCSVDDLRGVDWHLVRQLRTAVSERIATGRPGDDRPSRLDRDRDGQAAWEVIDQELREYQARRITIGDPAMSPADALALALALMDSLFGLGRLERYLHTEGLEDITIRGYDNVWLIYGDGRKERGPNAADSDEELIQDMQHLGATAAEGERPFSPAAPDLDLSIGKAGHRLSAAAWYTSRPAVTIRRQGFTRSRLSDLVVLGAIDEVIAQFLSAAVQAGLSIVVSGLPSSGKTTMIRAMLNELDPSVALATIETEFELALHNMPDLHPMVWAAQYRPGGEDGQGEVTLTSALGKSLRQSVDRIVVGEVRGHEITAMFDAMQAGKGSVSTIHANSAPDTIGRIVSAAIKVPPTTSEYAYRMVAANINLIVHIAVQDETPIGGRKLRYVDEILALHKSEDAPHGVGYTPLFAPGADGRAVATGNLPAWIGRLHMYGFDPGWLTGRQAMWAAPLDTVRPAVPHPGEAS